MIYKNAKKVLRSVSRRMHVLLLHLRIIDTKIFLLNLETQFNLISFLRNAAQTYFAKVFM